ncbi:MAG: hypothetical protein AB7O24_09885 [Kofleriaceae bacterium]
MTRRRGESHEDTIDDARADDFDPAATEISGAPDFDHLASDDDAPTKQLTLTGRPGTDTAIDAVAAPPGDGQVEEPHESMRMISMKTPTSGPPAPKPERELPRVRIRSLSGLRRRSGLAGAMPRGNLAPPRDPRQARARRTRDFLLWGSLVVILASGMALGIWFLAGQ